MNDAIDTATLRSILKSQYHAALAMLREAIERCPDEGVRWAGAGRRAPGA